MNKLKCSLEIKDFYSKLKFPGEYTIENISEYAGEIFNPYLKIIDRHLQDTTTVMDMGCGSGYIANLFAFKYDIKLVAVDFSDAINYAIKFSSENKIKNVVYHKQDIFDIDQNTTYDVIICQGVLHHVPNLQEVVAIIKKISKQKIILSVYHPTGKLLKKYMKLDYKDEMLRSDQEDVPYETSFTKKQIATMFDGFRIVDCYPKNANLEFLLHPIKHSRNGGLVTYILEKRL